LLLKRLWDSHGLRRLFLIFFTVTFFYTTGTRDKEFSEILLPDFVLQLAEKIYLVLKGLLQNVTSHPHAFDILWGLTGMLVLAGYTILALLVSGMILELFQKRIG
jgi:hypothetical protein